MGIWYIEVVNMDNTVHQYLNDLMDWGNDISRGLDESLSQDKNEQILERLRSWQSTILHLKESEQFISQHDLTAINAEGERILFDIKHSKQINNRNKGIPYGQRKLPALPYAYNALEPYISEEIMRLHHDKHHQGYVDGLNKAEKELYIKKPDAKFMKYWLREQAFHGSGHQLHTIFWFNMTPNSTKRPEGELSQKLNNDFGTWEQFKSLFTKTATSVEGDGWALLYWNPRNGKLGVQSFEKHQFFQIADIIPLLVLDMWEHAYYLQYKTDKKAYIENWWNVVNWNNVNNRYKKAKSLMWNLF